MGEHVLVVGASKEDADVLAKMPGALTASAVLDSGGSKGLSHMRGLLAALVVADKAPADHWIAMARAVHGLKPVTRAFTSEDRYMPHLAAIAWALGVPAVTEQTVSAVYHKPSVRARLNGVGIEDVPYALTASPAEIVDFGRRHGWPVVVKPARGTGATGVTRLDGPEGAEAAHREAGRRTRATGHGVLVEKCLAGPQYSVECFSEHGSHEVLTITRKYSSAPHMVGLCHALPAPLVDEEAQAVGEHARAVLSELGVTNGPSFVELVLTKDGPRVFELHLRPAGDGTTDMLRQTVGVDLHRLWALQLGGERVLRELRARLRTPVRRYAATWFAAPDVAGTLVEVEGVDEASAVPGVSGTRTLLRPGDRVRPLRCADDRGAAVCVVHDDPHAAVAVARQAAELIRFVVRVGSDQVRTAHSPTEIV